MWFTAEFPSFTHLQHIPGLDEDFLSRWTNPKFHPLAMNTKKVFSLVVLITFSVLMGSKCSVVMCEPWRSLRAGVCCILVLGNSGWIFLCCKSGKSLTSSPALNRDVLGGVGGWHSSLTWSAFNQHFYLTLHLTFILTCTTDIIS